MSTASGARGTPKGGGGRSQPSYIEGGTLSGIPRPKLESTPSEATTSFSASRAKQSKRDEAIRSKLEKDLGKRRGPAGRARQSRKAPPGTVLALKPNQALQIKPGTTVTEAAQMMAAKREDCVLVTDDDDRIAGIFTAKDLAFRVVGAGLNARNVTIAEIMTKNPLCAKTDTSATDALDLMVRKGFRHLPVMDENHDISGVLDITKCFYEAMEKLERAYTSSKKLYDALEGVQAELGSSQPQQVIQYVEAVRQRMSGPTLESVLNGLPPTTVSVRTSVKEAAQMMKENHTTAVLVQDQGQITGIFTSKDVVLRVIAAGLDPANCSVIRVMTPHPDFAPMDMSIQQALRKMHDGHYLNLPVMNKESDEIVGMVDVLKLTYATLDQINGMSAGDSEGPAWNKFWMSMEAETESMMSGEGGSHVPHTPDRSAMMSPEGNRPDFARGDSVLPTDSASHNGIEQEEASALAGAVEDTPFTFKFKAPGGRVHRLHVVASQGMPELISTIADKLGHEAETIGGVPAFENGKLQHAGFALSYLDNEGDTVSITTDHDLLEAIMLAKEARKDKVDLFVHDPEKPAHAATVDPQPAIIPPTPPPESSVRRRKQQDTSEDEEEEEDNVTQRRRDRKTAASQGVKPQEQIIQGVPNEILLPGAIGVLAVVILVTFTIGRSSR
ncbi:Putative PB1 domain, CBS domain-containing protein [Septoria linicola]|uniref:PB1 domain, CBS domain-containing protein n=1 Tax=Septoria linicola TaxID=215465 RepID=A0A9Q9EQQ6_9PEZI|nr:Putative PB1 domain, CBS domain-containing protein [Septoria linicola]